MSKRLPPLNALRVFDAAARHLSFTRAAEELFVTQAAVSHQIKSLEDFLGLKLFRRRNRSLLLTEEGQSYFLDIKEIFSQLTERRVNSRPVAPRGVDGQFTPVSPFIGWFRDFPALIQLIRELTFESRRLIVRKISWRMMLMWRYFMVGATGRGYGWKNCTPNIYCRCVRRYC